MVLDARLGALSMVPVLVAYVPYALVIGSVLAAHGGLAVGLAGTLAIFGGSAHLATVRSVEHAGVVAAILTGLLVNARVIVYSAGLARHWREQPWWFRVVAAPFVIDPTWAVGERLAADGFDLATHRRRFLAAGVTLAIGFSSTVAVGMLAGTRLPTGEMAIAVPLCLVAMVGTKLRDPAHRSVVVVAAAAAWITTSLPSGTGLLAATLAGCAAGHRARGVER